MCLGPDKAMFHWKTVFQQTKIRVEAGGHVKDANF